MNAIEFLVLKFRGQASGTGQQLSDLHDLTR